MQVQADMTSMRTHRATKALSDVTCEILPGQFPPQLEDKIWKTKSGREMLYSRLGFPSAQAWFRMVPLKCHCNGIQNQCFNKLTPLAFGTKTTALL